MNVLVIDIGGSSVKLLATGRETPRRFESGPHLEPSTLVAHVRELTSDWAYDVISIGYPGAVGPAGPTAEPGNLGSGWVGFDFPAAFGRPVRVANDAAMQAVGAYDGHGRMLFLGLGTGLGSTLVAEHVIIPLELGCLRFESDETLAERLGRDGLRRHGTAAWLEYLTGVTEVLRLSFAADHLVLGGGNAELVNPLPAFARRGGNHDAFEGGMRLWEERIEPHDRPSPRVWRVVQ